MDELDQVPDLVFSQPISTADEVAALVVEAAATGAREKVIPRPSGWLATLGYHSPSLTRLLRPFLVRKGAKVKQRYRSRRDQNH